MRPFPGHLNGRGLKRALYLGSTFAAIVAFGSYRFGSLSSAGAFLAGEGIHVDGRTRDIGTVKHGQSVDVSFTVTNLHGVPLKQSGARVSCSCLSVGKIPDRLALGRPEVISVKFAPKDDQAGKVVGELHAFFTADRAEEVVLKVIANVE